MDTRSALPTMLALTIALPTPAAAQVDEPLPPVAPATEGREPPSQGVFGHVIDAETGEPLVAAVVVVIDDDQTAVTDLEGAFTLELPPGRYSLRSFVDFHRGLRVDHVRVGPGRVTRLELELEPDPGEEQELAVSARAQTGTAATQMQIRRQSAVVQDSISAEEMSQAPGGTASDSVRRVVAASIVDGQYLFVRGLGGRYTNVLLNGATLPSLDPDLPGVQLDLFPAGLLDSIAIVKAFSPELPGSFAGGTMLLSTRSYPEDFTLRLSLSLGTNTATTFRQIPGYRGGRLDWLGFDDGTRTLPEEVPDRRVDIGRNGLSADEVEQIAEAFTNTWEPDRELALPSMGFGLTVGDTVQLGSRDLGYLWTLSYGLSTSRRQGRISSVRLEGEGEDQEVVLRERLDLESSSVEALWGTLGTFSLELAEDHDLSLVAFYAQSGEDTTRLVTGRLESEGADVRSHRLGYVERSLFFGQLIGDHRDLSWPPGARLTWRLDTAWVQRDEPDLRDLTYQQGEHGYYWRNVSGSGDRFFSTLDQLDFGGAVDAWVPIRRLTLRFGGSVRVTNRDFLARRFSMEFIGDSTAERLLEPEELFSAAGIGELSEMGEETRPDDGYESSQRNYAGYLMADSPIAGPLRLMGGVRLDVFDQSVTSSSPFTEDDDEVEGTDRVDYDVLPAAAVILELRRDMMLRLNYGGTVARPIVRELAPFLFQDFIRRRTVQGNPAIERTFIHNVDLRWEWFYGETELIAATFFYKYFDDPIEQVVLDRQGNITFENVDGAQNFGGELEARLSFGRLHRALDCLTLGANLTLVYSRVQLASEQLASATSAERPLAGQSPYVANLSLGLSFPDSGIEAGLYYNVFGRRIVDVGRLGLPDVYEEPFHSLDLRVSWSFTERFALTFTARNLAYQSAVLEQGGIEVGRYNPGISLGLKLGYTH